MIVADFLRALAQIGDPRFRRVLWIGLGLTLGLLIALTAVTVGAVGLFVPDHVTLPWIGQIGGIDAVLSWASVLLVMALSVVLMVPVASAFTGFFLEDVAQAVEDRFYPALPPVPRMPLAEMLADGLSFFAVLVVVNVLALAVYVFAGPLVPFLFWAINGYLLGREYFQMAAMRRIGRKAAGELRRQHPLQIWLAGTLLALPLSIPLVNLVMPILGAAAFTHLFHRLTGQSPARNGGTYPDRAMSPRPR